MSDTLSAQGHARQFLWGGFAIAIIAAATVGWIAYENDKNYSDWNDWVTHSQVVIETLDSARSDAFLAVMTLQVYYQTGERPQLDKFNTMVVDLRHQLTHLRTLTQENRSEQLRLDGLDRVAKDISVLTREAKLVASVARPDDLLDSADFTRFDSAFDRLHDGLSGMSVVERNLLARRLERARAASAGSIKAITIGGSVVFVWLMLVGGYSVLTTKRLQETAEDLIASREQLVATTSREKAYEQFRTLVESAPDAVVVTAADGAIRLVNEGAERLFGYERAELLGNNFEMLMPPRLRAGYSTDPRLRSSRTIMEILALHKGGAEIPVEVSLSQIPADDQVLTTLLVRDITARKQVEEELRTSEEHFRTLVEGVKDYAIFMLDRDGRVASWNHGAQAINGYSAEEIIGHHFSCFYPSEDIAAAMPAVSLEQARSEGRYECRGWRVRKDGSRFWADVVIAALYGTDGKLRGFAKVTRDITERRQAEEAVRELNENLERHAAQLEVSNKELEAFSYSVAHDLRAPLRALDGFSLALLEDYSERLDESARSYLGRIRSASQRMGQLIDDLLNLSHITRSEMRHEVVDLSALAKDILASFRQHEPERAVECLVPDGVQGEGDPRLLQMVLENLLSNAWKFTSKTPHATIELGMERNNGATVYFVRDNGAGFDMAYVGKLFGPFQRLHAADQFSGTGAGLTVVQRIIQRHGGHVWARGAEGKGAQFSFTL